MALLPLFLQLAGRKVVLVGAGRVALHKLRSLEAVGADVTVVSPAALPEFEGRHAALVARPFVPSDLDGAWFAVAAATREVNREVAVAAEARRLFVNVVDDPEVASAWAGAAFHRGGVTVALSTGGRAPALAGLLREGLEALLPEDLEAWVEAAEALRRDWRDGAVPMAQRRPLLLEALNRLHEARAPATLHATGAAPHPPRCGIP